MIIDDTDTYTDCGLRLIKAEGIHDLPARKRTLQFQEHAARDIVYQPQIVTLTLFGKYDSQEELGVGVETFRALIMDDVEHDFELNTVSAIKGSCRDGATVAIRKRTALVTIKVTVNYTAGNGMES